MAERLTIPKFDYDSNFVASNLKSWPIAQALKRLQAYEDWYVPWKVRRGGCFYNLKTEYELEMGVMRPGKGDAIE